MKILTRQEQRNREAAQIMLSVKLEFHLRNLVTEIRSGMVERLPEFQQCIQYAPAEMNVRLMNYLSESSN